MGAFDSKTKDAISFLPSRTEDRSIGSTEGRATDKEWNNPSHGAEGAICKSLLKRHMIGRELELI